MGEGGKRDHQKCPKQFNKVKEGGSGPFFVGKSCQLQKYLMKRWESERMAQDVGVYYASYSTAIKYNPSGGAVGPPAFLSHALSACSRSSAVHFPLPTQARLPTILRTW